MGLLDLYAAQADTAAPNPLQALPRTVGERVEATAAETFSPDRYFNIAGARRDAWQRTIDAIHENTGQAFLNPYGTNTPEEVMRLRNQPAITAERSQKVIEAARAAREMYPDLPDPEIIDRSIGEEAKRRRDKAASFEGTGNGILNFIAGAGMAAIEPLNVLSLALPVSRLPSAAASVIGETFMRNVGREALLQAGTNVALQGATEALDYTSRKEVGTEQTAGEIVHSLAGAALFGGAIGGGVRALHLKWLGLPEKVRAEAPLEVRDAFRVIEADAIYSGQNRLGVDPLLHERYQGRANDAVLRSRPVELADLNRTADTPMTALGTILRSAPDSIQARGLPEVMAHLESLPDSEIAAFAREVKPNSFARLDKVEAALAAAQAKLAEIDSRQPSIHDLLDPDTSMRLQDIERDLSAPALTRKQQTALEREREMIVSTVDPADRLPKEAAKAQRAERAEIQAEIDKLMPVREKAKVTADAATADLRRKMGRYSDLVQPADAGQLHADLGFKEPADLASAIVRVDVARQARMVREMVPDSPPPRASEATKAGERPAEPTPEQVKGLDTEAARIVEANPGREVSVDGRTMRAAEALEDADRMAKDATAALNCAVGAL